MSEYITYTVSITVEQAQDFLTQLDCLPMINKSYPAVAHVLNQAASLLKMELEDL